MQPEPTVLDSLRRAVEAMPDDVPPRVHLATMLLRAGQRDEAVRQLGAVLQRDPGHAEALGLLWDGPGQAEAAGQPPAAGVDNSAERSVVPPAAPPGAPGEGAGQRQPPPGQPPQYDWSQAEDELRDVLPAMFIGDAPEEASGGGLIRRKACGSHRRRLRHGP
jgi:hypothetical protein